MLFSKPIGFTIAIVGVLTTASCLDTIQGLEAAFCGLPINQAQQPPGVALTMSCDNGTALCPVSKGSGNTQFCQVSYQRGIDAQGNCGPATLAVCQPNSCSGVAPQNLQSATPRLSWPSVCTALFNASVVFLPVDEAAATLQQGMVATGRKVLKAPTSANTYTGYVRYTYYVTANKNAGPDIWISFAGSQDVCNWILDLDYELVSVASFHDMFIHRGFLSVAESAYSGGVDPNGLTVPGFKDILAPYKNQNPTIHLTGESLGAATALVLSMMLQNDGYTIGDVITFGEPQITNAAGVAIFNQYYGSLPFLRFVNRYDFIPYALNAISPEYKQMGPEVDVGLSNASYSAGSYAYLAQPDNYGVSDAGASFLTDHLPPAYIESMAFLGQGSPSCKLLPQLLEAMQNVGNSS